MHKSTNAPRVTAAEVIRQYPHIGQADAARIAERANRNAAERRELQRLMRERPRGK